MRGFDVSGVALALVLVPLVAWISGRIMGRRNWSITAVLAVACLFSLGIQSGILTLQSLIEWPLGTVGLTTLIERRGLEALSNPEFPVFLVIFAAFISMLSWSATPIDEALKKPTTPNA